MRLTRKSTTALCVAALAMASAGGLGLARYSEGGAFSYYKQRPLISPEMPSSQPAQVAWTYPVDMAPTRALAPPTPIDAIFASDAGAPALEAPAQPVRAYETGAVDDTAASAEVEAPVVQVSRGSWSQPQVDAAPPSGDESHEAAEAAPAIDTPPET